MHSLLVAIRNSPFEGIGKPEVLKYNLTVSSRGGLIQNTELSIRLWKLSKLLKFTP
ncbi:hypothetical protein [Pedobacter sp. MR2016-19]|uniref:hypothetical protein n=1 Tax=Pedobacter sp. MR2016-19 TaxID=2780089 RepID=UPI00351D2E53